MTFISDVKSLSNAKLRKAPRLSTRFNRSQIPRKTTAQQLTRPGLPPPPRMVQPNRMSFRLSQNVKPQSISNGNGNSEIESSHTIPPIHSATSPASTVAIPMQRPYPRQQPQPTQQAAPRQAAPNRNHKPASNHEPAFITSLGAAITCHTLKTTQTRLQPAVFRLYCNR